MKKCPRLFLSLFLASLLGSIFGSVFAFGQAMMSEAQALKVDAAHNQVRKNDFYRDRKQKAQFESNRERNVSEYQEKTLQFEKQREAGLAAYHRTKKDTSPSENGLEHRQDEKKKQEYEKRYEQAREEYIRTRKKFSSGGEDTKFEMEEYGLNLKRPRYVQSDRVKNKWVEKEKKSGGSSTSSGSSNFNNGGRPPFVPGVGAPSAFDQYQPGTDYIPPPPETFEDIPPPPPPVYEGQSVPYDAGFGEPPMPPPPPPMDFDF